MNDKQTAPQFIYDKYVELLNSTKLIEEKLKILKSMELLYMKYEYQIQHKENKSNINLNKNPSFTRIVTDNFEKQMKKYSNKEENWLKDMF